MAGGSAGRLIMGSRAMATLMSDITPFVDEGLGNSAYLVGIGDRRALVIDPPRDVRAFREAAERRSLTIAYAVETHLHADFVSGSRELAATGATIVASRDGGLQFPHRGLGDGEELDLGGLSLRAIATPGHTPEHLSYLLLDGDRALALFSGGALLPGGVARTDLIAPDATAPLTRSLFHAVHDRILSLPDEVSVYPTHGAGSFCSTPAGRERTTTVGRERATNPLLAAPDEDVFADRLLASLGTYPTYFGRLREVNRRGPKVYGTLPILRPLEPDEVERRVIEGAELVDVRPIRAFAAGHVPGSLSIDLRPSFASWLGWLVPADRALVFVLGPEQDRGEVVRQALGIGHESLAGELAGGVGAWAASGRPLATTPLSPDIDPAAGELIDVRQASEYRHAHVPGARPLELGSIPEAVDSLPATATFMCGVGERAMTAASLAERTGRRATVFEGGPKDWARRTGGRLVRE